ncbi:MAG: acyltransferase [Lysobacteraceae bacterium]|nr:MAG: acyltransferase [Xanthomonadaceae bacterium]
MKFKTDIEGLRGVAVLLVVLAHAGAPGLAGGFIGVDIFFVISGFLITALLTDELRESGRIDYWAFYARRARRLAPALLVMIALVTLAALWLLPRDVLTLQLTSAFWAVLWAANFHFTFAGFEYFGTGANGSLFLHTWSLAVEEQFYLVWPALIALLWRRFGTGISTLAWITIIGFMLSLAMLSHNAEAAYYLMPSRLWQLSLGGLVYRMSAGPWLTRPWIPGLAGGIGVVFLAASLVWIDGSRPYPGWDALFPTLAAGCLLVSGFSRAGWVPRLLSLQVLRLPGRISYSWYLWHWPFLMIMPVMGLGTPTMPLTLGLVLISFLVAWASYIWVEAPARRSSRSSRDSVLLALFASVIVAALLLVLGSLERPAPEAWADSLEGRVGAAISVPEIYSRPGCDDWYSSSDLVPCASGKVAEGSVAPEGVVVFIGDSVGAQWLPALEKVADQWRYRLIVLTKSSCPIADVPFVYPRINRRFTECEEWRQKAIEFVEANSPDIVVIGSTQYDFTEKQWRDGTVRIVNLLAAPERPVLILAPTPILPFNAPLCVITTGRLVGDSLQAPDCASPLAKSDSTTVTAYLRSAVVSGGQGEVVYLNDLVCPDQQCRALINGRLVYRDEQHLNADFVESLTPAVALRLRSAIETIRNR